MIKPLLQSVRFPFLVLTPICVFLGTSTLIAAQTPLNVSFLILVLLGSLLAHISVNTLNEYLDFKSGLDLRTNKTPFSGGSGALPSHPELANMVLITGLVSFAGTGIIGLFFVWQSGWGILPLGLAGLLIIATYTDRINKQPWLCLIAPGLSFGFLIVVGTQYVLQGQYTFTPWFAAAVPFFLVNNLLLLNQFPDIDADRSIGRYHFPIAYGTKKSTWVFGLFTLAAACTIMLGVMLRYFPLLSVLALAPLLLSVFALSGAVKYQDKIGHRPHYMGANVAATLLTPLLLALSLTWG